MDKLLIRGGRTLQGEVQVSGAKNAALPELCAALLTDQAVTLTNVPRLQDVATMLKLIRNMGVTVDRNDEGQVRLNAGTLPPAGIAADAPATSLAALPTGKPEPLGIGLVLAAVLPENAIVVDESVSTGRGFEVPTMGARPHDWLNVMGGSIGFGLPSGVGAAIAAPDRPVIVLEGDGSGMYTEQALWTMAREGLKVKVVVFANRAYQILKGELSQVGAGTPGERARDMLTLDRPHLDWVSLARGHGVPGRRVETLEGLAQSLVEALATPGPVLIEVLM